MKKYGFNEITFLQFIFIIHGAQVGSGVYSLPLKLAEKAGTDGWISLILAYFCNLIISVIIVQIFKKYPEDTLVDLLTRLFGKFFGKVLTIPIIMYFAFFVWTLLSSTMLYIKQWFLPMTPDYIVMILLAVPGYLIAKQGVRILGRYSELVFYLTFWMFFILLFPVKESHWIHLLPIIKEGWLPILQGVESATYSFLGFEVVFFLYPFLQKKQLALRGLVIANSLTLLVYLGITLICFAFFSPDGITEYNQPLFNLLKVIEFRFLERFDMIFLALYLFIISTTWLPYTFAAILSVGELFGKKNPAPYATILLLAIVVLSVFFNPSWNQTEKEMELVSKAGIWFAYVFPFFLYLYVLVYNFLRRSETK